MSARLRALAADTAGWFDQVTFAVLDRAGGPAYAAFARRLLPG